MTTTSPADLVLTTPPPLQRIDYTDDFHVPRGAHDRTPEQWARQTWEESPTALRRFLITVWTGLGVPLGKKGDPDYVFGWKILRNEPDVIVTGVELRIGITVRLVLRASPQADDVTLDTFVQNDGPLARAVWTSVAPIHRQIAPRLLRHAADSTD